MKIVRVAPSILAIDYNNKEVLLENLQRLEKSAASLVHLDVMDGKFVKNKSFDHTLVEFIKNHSTLVLDVHLMVKNPELVIEDYIKAGADILTVHYEATENLYETLKKIKSYNCLAGVAINPKTSVLKLKDIIKSDLVDMVTIMGVNPGAYGQEFILSTYEKIVEVRELDKNILIEVDGGVTIKNSKILRKLGVNVIVSGATVFRSKNINKTIKELKGKNALLSFFKKK